MVIKKIRIYLIFEHLKKNVSNNLHWQNSFQPQPDVDGLFASYNISLMIAKSGKPHTIGEELIIPAISEVIRTVLHKPASDIIKKI